MKSLEQHPAGGAAPNPPASRRPRGVVGALGAALAAALPVGSPALANGTGFVVHRDGVIATAHHVIAPCRGVVVHVPGGPPAPAQVIVADGELSDLALLRIPLSFARALPLEDGYAADAGKRISIFGYPGGVAGSLHRSRGVLTSRIFLDAPGEWKRRGLASFAASIERGFSGGPVLDEMGAVVAISVGRRRNAGGGPSREAYGLGAVVLRTHLSAAGFAPTPAASAVLSDRELERLAAATVLPVACSTSPQAARR